MQTIIYANISKADLCYLFGIGEQVFNQWVKQGLPCEPDERFSLSKVCRWVKEYTKIIEQQKIKTDSVCQKDLSALFGITRQALHNWDRAGLPHSKDGTYNLKTVVCWLRGYYCKDAERKYQQRLKLLQKKLCRNVAQLERFFAGGK